MKKNNFRLATPLYNVHNCHVSFLMVENTPLYFYYLFLLFKARPKEKRIGLGGQVKLNIRSICGKKADRRSK